MIDPVLLRDRPELVRRSQQSRGVPVETVDDALRAKSADVLHVIRRRSCDRVEPGFPSELHGERTDIAGRSMDENTLSVLQASLIEQGLPGSHRDHGE